MSADAATGLSPARVATRSSARLRKAGLGERLQFRLLVGLSFAVCLFGFALRRLSGRAPKGSSYWSCVTDARAAAYAAVGYAYHG